MTTRLQRLTAIFAVSSLMLLAACVTTTPGYAPSDIATQSMSREQARAILIKQLKGSYICYDRVGNFSTVAKAYVTSKRLFITDANGRESVITLKTLPPLTCFNLDDCLPIASQPELIVCRQNFGGGASRIADALYVLKRDASSRPGDYDAHFDASLPEYRRIATSDIEIPENAVKFKVQAEGAVRDKQFDLAADLYFEALQLVPWWPVGHFNRALVLGEIGEYDDAILEMQRYVQLVPDAANARAAQDKIYDWERLKLQ